MVFFACQLRNQFVGTACTAWWPPVRQMRVVWADFSAGVKPELKTTPPARRRAPNPLNDAKLHTNDTYLTSLRCSPGGSDCSSFAAFSPSCTLRV